MPTVLSTKRLSQSQKQLLLNGGIGLVEYDAIKVKHLSFSVEVNPNTNLIFTSKNAVTAVLRQYGSSSLAANKIFCVGEKTKEVLKSYNLKVLETASYGVDLATSIIQNYKNGSFIYFCGNIRRDELPNLLEKHQVQFEEVEVYETSLNPTSFNSDFDAILFYSPSGVQSFFSKNPSAGSTAICIGKTTAAEAKKYSAKIITATKPSVENVIVQAVKSLGRTATANGSENK